MLITILLTTLPTSVGSSINIDGAEVVDTYTGGASADGDERIKNLFKIKNINKSAKFKKPDFTK